MPRHLPRSQPRSTCCVGLAIALFATAASAESALQLPYPPPEAFGVTPASTYDEEGQRVGDARVQLERLANGHVAVHLRSGFDGGARIALDAELAPIDVDGRRMLRILHERSQSHDPDGKPLVVLEVDHVKGVASCTPPEGDAGDPSQLELPTPDRIVNVPLNLLFQPLANGDTDRVDTQAFFCLGGARVMGFNGKLASPRKNSETGNRKIREVRYGPDGKGLLSWAARPFAPKISFWMDAANNGAYVAHRMPLYSRGPVVYVIAEGIDPEAVITR